MGQGAVGAAQQSLFGVLDLGGDALQARIVFRGQCGEDAPGCPEFVVQAQGPLLPPPRSPPRWVRGRTRAPSAYAGCRGAPAAVLADEARVTRA
jgi:hypothetical protein